MSQNVRQDISALMDGDLAGSAADDVIKSLKNESALKATWGRYHTARSAMKREYTPGIGTDLLSRVQAALEADPVYLTVAAQAERETAKAQNDEQNDVVGELPVAIPRYRLGRPFAFATAASVAVASFVALEMLSDPPARGVESGLAATSSVSVDSPTPQVVSAPAKVSPRFQAPPAPVIVTQAGPVENDQWRRLAVGDIPRLDHYLVQHESLVPNGDVQSGMYSSAHVVSFGTDAAK